MLRPGFEPESSARKAEMIGRTTPPEHMILKLISGPNGVRTHGRPVMSRALYLAKLWAQSAADRARTCDQSVNSRTLYLLSYGGNFQVKPAKFANYFLEWQVF